MDWWVKNQIQVRSEHWLALFPHLSFFIKRLSIMQVHSCDTYENLSISQEFLHKRLAGHSAHTSLLSPAFFLTHTHITHLNWKLKNADLIWELKNQIATGFFPTLRFLQLSQLARWRHTCHRRNARFPIPPSRLSVLRHLHQLNRPRENWEAEPVGSDLEMVVFGLGDVCWFWRGLGYGIEWWVKVQSIVCWNGSKYWSSFTSLAFEMLR